MRNVICLFYFAKAKISFNKYHYLYLSKYYLRPVVIEFFNDDVNDTLLTCFNI